MLGDVAWRSSDLASAGMITNVEAWVLEYAARRYPTDSAEAAGHVANAWSALLEAGYGGNRTLAGAGASGSTGSAATAPSSPPARAACV